MLMDTIIERELDLRLLLSPGRSVAVPARLGYRTGDPYAVHLTFHINSEFPVHWTFARELMIEGVFRPTGEGDVRVWPSGADGGNAVCLALSSPDGNALLMLPSGPLSAWLERTLRLVPAGTEPELFGFEAELSAMLASFPGDDPGQTGRGTPGGGQAGS